MNHFEGQVLDEGNCQWTTSRGKEACGRERWVCHRHPDIFRSNLQCYVQKLRIVAEQGLLSIKSLWAQLAPIRRTA